MDKSLNDFIINLSIECCPVYVETVATVIDPKNKTIRYLVTKIVEDFELPKFDMQGSPILYLLGRRTNADDDGEILDFEDENGHECSLLDYNVKLGGNLFLTTVHAI